MKNPTLIMSIIGILFLGACSHSGPRVDDLFFGNKRTGLQKENPTFRAGESVQLSYKLRGFKADSSGKGKVTSSFKFEPEMDSTNHERIRDLQGEKLEGFEFPVKSEITHVSAPTVYRTVPLDVKTGEGKLVISVRDDVAGKEILREVPFRTEAVEMSRVQENELKICGTNLVMLDISLEMHALDKGSPPETLRDLEDADSLLKCPAAGTDTYSASYRPRGNEWVLFCSGTHHNEANVPADHPALDHGEIRYR